MKVFGYLDDYDCEAEATGSVEGVALELKGDLATRVFQLDPDAAERLGAELLTAARIARES